MRNCWNLKRRGSSNKFEPGSRVRAEVWYTMASALQVASQVELLKDLVLRELQALADQCASQQEADHITGTITLLHMFPYHAYVAVNKMDDS